MDNADRIAERLAKEIALAPREAGYGVTQAAMARLLADELRPLIAEADNMAGELTESEYQSDIDAADRYLAALAKLTGEKP